MDTHNWNEILKDVNYAFQPIVHPVSGSTVAVEALLRPGPETPFAGPGELINAACDDGKLFDVDLALREKVLERFKTIPFYKSIKLFYNYDPRLQEMDNYRFGEMERLIQDHGINDDAICLELSEKHPFEKEKLIKLLSGTKGRGFYIALDDFGSGFSGLELFYNSEPDFLKFDRFLISDINRDMKKRAFCNHLISLAHLHGVMALAEGVETIQELNVCKDLGFDLVQGYFVEHPQVDVSRLQKTYYDLQALEAKNRRHLNHSSRKVYEQAEKIPTVSITDKIEHVFHWFQKDKHRSFFPVLDTTGYPLGIIHEKSFKEYLYNPYGYNLLANKTIENYRDSFVIKCPIADLRTPQDKIIQMFVATTDAVGVIITNNMEYVGFLEARALLTIINDNNIAYAREVNPLTKLPGNMLINRHLAQLEIEQDHCHYLVYFDFNYFKPFNDKFGFRQGDRVILLFADILNKHLQGHFVGHIGGDDFVAAFSLEHEDDDFVFNLTQLVQESFRQSVVSFYSADEIEAGCHTSVGRFGETFQAPLLSVSSAILKINPGWDSSSLNFHENLHEKLTLVKKEAKSNQDLMAFRLFC